jgi:hypothetical protein
MKWGTRHGRMQITIKGTPRAHWYYWVKQEGVRDFRAGYYGFGQEIAFRDKSFATSAQARKYCEAKDAEAVIIVGEPTHPVYAEGGALHRKILGM